MMRTLKLVIMLGLVLIPTGIAFGVMTLTTRVDYCSSTAQEARRADLAYETGTMTTTTERKCQR